MLSLLSLLLGGPVLAWVRTVYTRLSGTNDRAPFRPDRSDNFLVAANETAADMLCCTLYPRIQTFPSTDLHLHGGGPPSEILPKVKRCVSKAEIAEGDRCAQSHQLKNHQWNAS